MLRTGLLILYSWATTLLLKLLLPRLARHPKLRYQLAGRPSVRELATAVARARSLHQRCAVFFCSSAGEYEQAKPLVERLLAAPSTYVQILFVSQSGLAFARARGETAPCALCPVTDSVFDWGHLFTALRPDVVAVIRYEVWPGFVDTARHFAKVYLVDASRSLGESKSGIKRRFRAAMLGWFDRVYTVTAADSASFAEIYGLAPDKLEVAGDTKYDRVRERALARRADAEAWRARMAPAAGGRRRLIVGSAHPADVKALVAATALFPGWNAQWQVVIAPHHVEPERIAGIMSLLRQAGIEPVSFTALTGHEPAIDVLVLDTMGMLAEVYGACDAALVGGAMHHKIHNVLEPACHGLALAFGPFYKNSQEAVLLAEAGHAAVVRDGAALATWWQGLSSKDADGAGTRPALQAAVEQLCGASDRILAAWRRTLDAR